MVEPRAKLPNGDNVTLRELFARFEGQRELIDERDRRYEERFEAQETALAKADIKLAEYKENSNEWRSESKDRAAEYPTRNELEALLNSVKGEVMRLDKEVRDLRESRVAVSAAVVQQDKGREQSNATMGIVIAAIGMAGGVAVSVASLLLAQ